MSNKQKTQLTRLYRKYYNSNGKKGVLGFLKSFMPEIIFRTTRLEGERVTRGSIKSLF